VTPKFIFVLATSVAFASVPQIAHASCSGSACNLFSVQGKKYSISEKRIMAVFINEDERRGIRLKGCVMEAGKCSRNFSLEIDPGLKSQVSERAATRDATLDVNIANLVPQRSSGPAATPQQCQKQCIRNGTQAERANCLKQCYQSTTPSPSGAESFRIPGASLEPAGWDELDGWAADDHASAFATFQASCRPMMRSSFSKDMRPVRAALQTVCARAVKAGPLDMEASLRFFEANFRPIRIRKLGDAAGFLTGYYEPIVDGSRFPTREFTVPLYRRPPDLVAAGATKPGGPFPNTGRAFRKTTSGALVPYHDRGEIEDGALDGQRLEICWLRSPTEALLIQIEGSARIRLEDGTMLRVNYDAHNGYPYVPVERVLIDRKTIPRGELSIQGIREWMQNHPDEAKDVLRQNRSVVFFRIVGLTDEGEAIGAQGIPLSAGRSIAVDKTLHVYGTPFFIEAELPTGNGRASTPFRRTMIAQDTGSAIVGPARADLYFGAGSEAGQAAGRVRQAARFAMLLPRELDPVAAGSGVPLPLPRPTMLIRPHPVRPPTTVGSDKVGTKSEQELLSAEVKPRGASHAFAR
jgi:membrane-bound lytic murein transglycosylase A